MASPSIDQMSINRTVNPFVGAESLFLDPSGTQQANAPVSGEGSQPGMSESATTYQPETNAYGYHHGPGIAGTRETSAALADDGRDGSGGDIPRSDGHIDTDRPDGGGDGDGGNGDGGGVGEGQGEDGGGVGLDTSGIIENVLSGVGGDGGSMPVVGDVAGSVAQTVGSAIGSSGSLNLPNLGGLVDVNGLDVGGLDLAGLTNVTGLVQDALSGIGGGGLVPNVGNLITPLTDPLLGGNGNISLDGLLDGIGDTTGGLLDGVLNQVTGDGSLVGGVLNALGDDLLGTTIGGSGLLAGTPLAGLTGDGALLSGGVMQGDDSNATGLLQLGAGNDPSDGLLNLDAASNDGTSESGHIVGLQAGPQTSGSGLETDLLGANRDSSGSLVDGAIGQHDGPSVIDVNALTAADSFEFPALNGAGLDSLLGAVGSPVGGGDAGLLPISVGLDGNAVIDVGTDGLVDLGSQQHVQSGTDLMLNTPFHA